jgi:ferredoxin/flavodoxin---NADP+ reductase
VTSPIDDQRVIDIFAEPYNATLVHREDLNPDLAYFRVKLDGPAIPFVPGQYMTTGVIADEKMLQRPYSIASAPETADTTGYEFFVRHVPVVRFTTALWRLQVGHRMRMIGPKGKFTLEPEDARTHLYVSTGTGIAPFMSMIRQSMADGKPRKTVMLNGCSFADELGYRAELEQWEQDPAYRVTYVPTVSRPSDARNAGWAGRTGRAEGVIKDVCKDLSLKPEKTVVYICGNPEMILNVERELMDRGFPEFHVKKELYWPKGKPGAPAPAG